ncbi:MAG TPA: hypothetical protein DET40_05740 [Lentisphaeria bacterium]|nr:MAG: hypothetical protein A2X45_12480 [Lentisphaerae bacterium GWF2_50_93]HCE43029.1 hypothetical protein [Lentisphaeria bacterium]
MEAGACTLILLHFRITFIISIFMDCDFKPQQLKHLEILMPSKRLFFPGAVLICLMIIASTSCSTLMSQDPIKGKVFELQNPGFEDGLEGWTLGREDAGISVANPEAARTGKVGLRITDKSSKEGSSLYSKAFPAVPDKEYRAQCYARCVKGTGGSGMYLQFLDENGKEINSGNSEVTSLAGVRDWTKSEVSAYAPDKTVSVRIWFHSYGSAVVTEDIDDVIIYEAEPSIFSNRPWEPQYKIRPDEKEKLTAADIIGPDGIVYPDFRYAGVRGGIPDVAVVKDLSGTVKPNMDIADAIMRAASELPVTGGAILIPAGEYFLGAPVQIARSGVVIRGAGRDKTKLVFNYAVPKNSVQFYGIDANKPFGYFEVHANPENLRGIYLYEGDKSVKSVLYHAHWGNTYLLRVWNKDVLKVTGAGIHKLRAKAEYADGTTSEKEIEATVSETQPSERAPSMPGVIEFTGEKTGEKIKLSKDGGRGATSLTIEDASSFAVGDVFEIEAPASPRWNEMVKNACKWGSYRVNQYRITGIDGKTLQFGQPLRIDFPVVDGSFVVKIIPVEKSGIEDCTIEQTENLWINSASLSYTWDCWVKNVKTIKSGRNITYFMNSKHGEIRDCVFEDAWFKGGGGTAYAGFERTFDCLMENVESTNLRHGPNLNWACAGNVIRNSTFRGSDAQWHCGWSHENLFENCVITPDGKDGDYGFGFFATPPEDNAHGPIGPRNVVYNCDASSPKDGMQIKGMNENWIIMYNRIRIGKGRAMFFRMGSFDHIVRGNVFCIKDAQNPVVLLNDPTCVGNEFRDNKFYGATSPAIGGRAKPLVDVDNQVFPYEEAPRPTPAVPSIFEWQRMAYPLK